MWYCSPSVGNKGLHPAAPHLVGGKAAGLLRINPLWYPASIFLQPHNSDRSLPEDAAQCVSSVPSGILDELAAMSPQGRLFVRSSAPEESMRERGSFTSYPSLRHGIEEAIQAVWQQAIDEQLVGAHVRIGIVVQPLLSVLVRGHLSNEFRISREYRQWTSEIEEPPGKAVQWRVARSVTAGKEALQCSSIDQLDTVLRAVASSMSTPSRRFHMEWVWDGRQVWIVQADSVDEVRGPAPGDAWAPTRGLPISAGSLVAFKAFSQKNDEKDNWPKLRAVREFSSASLPTTDLFVLSGSEWLTNIAKGEIPPAVSNDLKLISSGHIVIRTDVRGPTPTFMLPKTKATCDHVELETFLVRTLQTLSPEVGIDDVAFIAHRFLRSRGSAWAFATPRERLVRIDANWGLPDGLNWLPHDSFLVDVRSGEVRRSILGKTDFLDVAEDESWAPRETPSEWIWRAVLSDAQARLIATATQRLADVSSRPALVMWFVELLDGSDHSLLPWFMANDVPSIQVRKSRWEDGRAVTIRTREDLAAVGESGADSFRRMILEPSPALMRDKEFVDAVGEVAGHFGLTVEMQGSRLAHAYYLLRKRGLVVQTRESELGERTFGKLVRDRIPEHVERGGETSEVYLARPEEIEQLLRQKLVEEALEVRSAEGVAEVMAELGDVEEVVNAILHQIGETRTALDAIQRKKRADRGGFESGRVLVRTMGPGAPMALDDLAMLPGLELLAPRRGGRRAEVTLDKIRLPLVPPGPLDANEESVQLSGQGVRARIRYGARFVELEFGELKDGIEGPGGPTLF